MEIEKNGEREDAVIHMKSQSSIFQRGLLISQRTQWCTAVAMEHGTKKKVPGQGGSIELNSVLLHHDSCTPIMEARGSLFFSDWHWRRKRAERG